MGHSESKYSGIAPAWSKSQRVEQGCNCRSVSCSRVFRTHTAWVWWGVEWGSTRQDSPVTCKEKKEARLHWLHLIYASTINFTLKWELRIQCIIWFLLREIFIFGKCVLEGLKIRVRRFQTGSWQAGSFTDLFCFGVHNDLLFLKLVLDISRAEAFT